MLRNLWEFLLYKPLINALALLVAVMPGGDLGLAVVVLTIAIKLLLYPLSQHAIENQAKMAELAPELSNIRKKGLSKEEQARLTLDLYAKHKTNPFSGCLVQIPIIVIFISLYYIFYKGVNFDPAILYSFVSGPDKVNLIFLGLIDISKKSLILAVFAGISQYLQARFMPKPPMNAEAGSFQDSFNKSMGFQMKYLFPVLIAFVAYSSGALALYWITSNLFTVGQQIYAERKEAKRLKEMNLEQS